MTRSGLGWDHFNGPSRYGVASQMPVIWYLYLRSAGSQVQICFSKMIKNINNFLAQLYQPQPA